MLCFLGLPHKAGVRPNQKIARHIGLMSEGVWGFPKVKGTF